MRGATWMAWIHPLIPECYVASYLGEQGQMTRLLQTERADWPCCTTSLAKQKEEDDEKIRRRVLAVWYSCYCFRELALEWRRRGAYMFVCNAHASCCR
ncbi:hypothetical protein KY290_000330 [Solanum tuberosum]|uniref:Uncharacterized protein n=1 Tax=Solanum tuberosum TaxID=4113 RepID=A0ABQ7WJ08_SOLTU|nr:hypothetical protein KY290_000330 [Solanum tuberosum]